MQNKRLAIFCGSKSGNKDSYKNATIKLAHYMTRNNLDLVYGGGRVGLMGILADEILNLGGRVYGVIPRKLMEMEVGHKGITDLKIVDTMHERKALMAEMADGFVALPGGIGTLEEIIEVFTWQQIGYHSKPCALLNVDGYYSELIKFIDKMVDHGFLNRAQARRMMLSPTAEALITDILKHI